MGVFGVSKYIAVPVGAALVWMVIVRGRYKPVERMLIVVFADLFHLPDLRIPGQTGLEARAARHSRSRSSTAIRNTWS